MSLGLSITQLWNDQSIKQVYDLSNQFQLNETAGYFLDNAKRICNSDYVPTIKDILHSRLKTVGAIELQIKMKGTDFRVIDVGGQRSQRTKWLNYFDNVHGVLYIASLSGYNLVLEEEPTTNRMMESLKLFHTLTSSPIFAKTSFMLFLNKTDVFREKLKRYPLRMCFEYYTGPNKFEQALEYVEARFRAHFQQSRILARKTREVSDNPGLYKIRKDDKEYTDKTHRLYVHHTCATDTDQMEYVFDVTADVILQNVLNEIGLM